MLHSVEKISKQIEARDIEILYNALKKRFPQRDIPNLLNKKNKVLSESHQTPIGTSRVSFSVTPPLQMSAHKTSSEFPLTAVSTQM